MARARVASVNLTRSFEQLRIRLAASDRADGRPDELGILLESIEEHVSGLDQAVEALCTVFDGSSGPEQRLIAREREIQRLRAKLDESLRYRARLNQNLAKHKQANEAVEAELALMRGSFAFRSGQLLVGAARSPRKLLRLPLDFMGLARELWPRLRARVARPATTDDSSPDLGPAMSLPSDDIAPVELEGERTRPVHRMLHGTDTAPQLPEGEVLRIATIMDEFSFNAFAPCGDLRQLGGDEWKREIEVIQPHMLLVESAWKGKDESWARKVYPLSRDLKELVAWCRERRIPTVFWNKEDPVHLSVFMRTAREFDFVFTTDIDCVRAYKSALGHDQVYWLPFACQPDEHNPIEEYQRKDGFCFAGSYYAKYPERQRDFEAIVRAVSSLKPVEIYDRNANGDDPGLKFPAQYESMIRGALPYSEISLAYKGYEYGININTVKQSQSMFARRAFELLASNTVTVSNYSRGLRMLLGDLVISSDDGQQVLRRLEPLVEDEKSRRKFRLAGLRTVMAEHTYQDRMRYLIEKVGAKPVEDDLPNVVVVARADDQHSAQRLIAAFQLQQYARKQLVLVVADGLELHGTADAEVITDSSAAGIDPSQRWPNTWIACFRTGDHYGRHYLTDLALATRYAGTDVVGKAAYFSCLGGEALLKDPELAYQRNLEIPASRTLARSSVLSTLDFAAVIDDPEKVVLENAVSIDEFNYCADGAEIDTDAVDDLPDLWLGVGTERLHRLAETATAADALALERLSSPAIDGAGLGNILPLGDHEGGAVSLQLIEGDLVLKSSLAADSHAYLYSKKPLPLEQLFADQVGKFNMVVETEALISIVFIFLDSQRKRIGHAIRACASNLSLSAPAGTHSIRLGLRIQGAGHARIKRLVLGHVPSPVAGVPSKGRHLVISRGYPGYDNLYSYAYVHSRIKGYAKAGVPVDVFRLTEDPLAFREFEGVDIASGQLSDLELAVRSNPYQSLMVHSLDRALWAMLTQGAAGRKILVWVHGAEIQPWYQRDFSFIDARDRERGIQRSNDRMAFWRELFTDPPPNVTFIFVSRHLAREAMRDVGIDLEPSQYVVIHNHIDGDLFAYHPKPAEHRKRILSIRPYTRPTYANDLTVKAILDLVDEPFFPELEFLLVGDGPLFDQTVEPIRHLPNVVVMKRFLSQAEIAALHREYGVFLTPSRIDSQGVSRDEAMSSGLVPITNRVSAIPEFVDESCAFLADPEDWKEMANAIRRLYADPHLFSQMSAAAARRVRTQSNVEQTIGRELDLMQGPLPEPHAAPESTPRGAPVAVYGDLDLNLIDGSAVWAASLAELLALGDAIDVDLYLKAPIRNTAVLKGVLGRPNVRLIEPPPATDRLQPEEALAAIMQRDAQRNYQAIILRGFDLAKAATKIGALSGRLWIYLTDIPEREEDFTPEAHEAIGQVIDAARYVLCQTRPLQQHLHKLVPKAADKTRLLPPMIPSRAERLRPGRDPGDPIRLAYAGKFAPLWGIRELFATVRELRSRGNAVELHLFGDKIHNPPDDPEFREYVRAELTGADGVTWHKGLSRHEVMEAMGEMDMGWAWRSEELESSTLEMSTKVLEYLSCGVPPILAGNRINTALLGESYPLFVERQEIVPRLESVLSGAIELDVLVDDLKTVADEFTFQSVRRQYIEPLLRDGSATEARN